VIAVALTVYTGIVAVPVGRKKHDGAVVYVAAKVSVHVVAPDPVVTTPATSLPAIDGEVPHDVSAGAVPTPLRCAVPVIDSSPFD